MILLFATMKRNRWNVRILITSRDAQVFYIISRQLIADENPLSFDEHAESVLIISRRETCFDIMFLHVYIIHVVFGLLIINHYIHDVQFIRLLSRTPDRVAARRYYFNDVPRRFHQRLKLRARRRRCAAATSYYSSKTIIYLNYNIIPTLDRYKWSENLTLNLF